MTATVQERTLTPEVRSLIEVLCSGFERRRASLLAQRLKYRAALAEGAVHAREETAHIRSAKWTVDPVPEHLAERRVELLGGATRSELVNGFNAGAKTYIADLWNFTLQDTWSILRAHRNLERAARRDLAYLSPDGDRLRINPRSQTRLMVVPRPLDQLESAVLYDDAPVAAAMFDLALFVLNAGEALIERQGGIQLMLRDVQTHLEARLWVQLFDTLEEYLEVERGTIRATIMIDNIPAALEMEEILFEFMHHCSGMSIDPQGYAADHIALFHGNDRPVLPDRETIGTNAPFLRSLNLHMIGVCHARGCHALGAPSFVLPPLDPEKLKASYLEMLSDKEREAVDGCDGTIVVHEGTVNAAMIEFNKSMPRANQIYYKRTDEVKPSDLVRRPEGQVSVESLVGSIRTLLRGLNASDGRGWVVQGGRMHDRSSLRLALRMLWHWNHSDKGVISASGLDVHDDLLKYLVKKEAEKMFGEEAVSNRRIARSMEWMVSAMLGESLPDVPLES